VQVTAIGADDGSMSLFIGGGQKLVLGSDATTLSAVPDAFDVAKLHVGLTDASGGHPFPDDLMGGGSIAGLLRFQRDDLTDARNLLGQMARRSPARSTASRRSASTWPAGRRRRADLQHRRARVLPSSSNAKDAAARVPRSTQRHLRADGQLHDHRREPAARQRLRGAPDPARPATTS
jgi:flagellar hook-associated protein 1 FlgK